MISVNQNFKHITNSGNSKRTIEDCGDFTGRIVGYEDISLPEYPSMKGKIIIEVEGKEGVFNDIINFNDSTEKDYKDSLGWLQRHVKSAMISAGKQADYSQEVSVDWCSTEIDRLVAEKATVKFNQSLNEFVDDNGKVHKKLAITYLNH